MQEQKQGVSQYQLVRGAENAREGLICNRKTVHGQEHLESICNQANEQKELKKQKVCQKQECL